MTKLNTSLNPVIQELENLFSRFNQKFYNNELVHPIITIIPKGKRNCIGWCTNNYSWKKFSDDTSKKSESYYEINICAEYISLPFEKLAETLLHEMAHLYCSQHGITDTSRSGTYHNQEYKRIAESHGLVTEKYASYGWASTKLNPLAVKFISTLTPFKFDISRIQLETTTKKKQSMKKIVCPICGNSARVTSSKTHLLCGDCVTPLISVGN